MNLQKRVLIAWQALLDSEFIDEKTVREWVDTQRYLEAHTKRKNKLVFNPEIVESVEDEFLRYR